MKLSRASSYALAYLAHLAREKPDKPVPSHEVARELDLPEAPPVSKEGASLDKRLQAVCDEVLAVVRERLAKVTLAELAKGK